MRNNLEGRRSRDVSCYWVINGVSVPDFSLPIAGRDCYVNARTAIVPGRMLDSVVDRASRLQWNGSELPRLPTLKTLPAIILQPPVPAGLGSKK